MRHIWVKKLSNNYKFTCDYCDIPYSEDVAQETCLQYPIFRNLIEKKDNIRRSLELAS